MLQLPLGGELLLVWLKQFYLPWGSLLSDKHYCYRLIERDRGHTQTFNKFYSHVLEASFLKPLLSEKAVL